MKKPKRILSVIHDPGACGMLLPVLRELSVSNRENFFLFASDFVKNRLKSNGIPFMGIGSSPTDAEIVDMFSISNPEVVLTGTGWGTSLVQKVRNFARCENLKSIAVVDYWVGYLERWQGSNVPLNQIQDEICVIDDFMKREMIEVGFPSSAIEITGHPYLEEISFYNIESNPKPMSPSRILILSEPVRDPRLRTQADASLAKIGKFLEVLAVALESKSEVHFKAHPKERQGLPQRLKLSNWTSLSLRLADSDLKLPEDFKKFDLVIGYQSMGLLEAATMGLPTVAIPTAPLKNGVTNAFNNAGILVIFNEEINSALAQNFENWKNQERRKSAPQYVGATQAILKKLRGSEV